MNCDTLITTLAQSKADLQARGVRHLAVFGSYARGEAGPDSDLDVLVDIDPARSNFSLIDLARIASILTDLTGVETNPIERNAVDRNPAFAQRIADDVIEIF
jgi:predicted nucleotidyltransferase